VTTTTPTTTTTTTPTTTTTTPTTNNATTATANATTLPPPTTAPLRFEEILSQAWIDNIVAERFLTPSIDTATLNKDVGNRELGAGGFMLTFDDTQARFTLTPCGEEVVPYEPIDLPKQVNSTAPPDGGLNRTCAGDCGFTGEAWVLPDEGSGLDILGEIGAGDDSYLLPDSAVPGQVRDEDSGAGGTVVGPMDPDVRLNTSRCIPTARQYGILSFYTDFENAISFNVFVSGGVVVVTWGRFRLVTDITICDGLWTHVAVSWRSDDGRIELNVHRPGLPPETRVYVGILTGCDLEPDGEVQVGRVVAPVPGFLPTTAGPSRRRRDANVTASPTTTTSVATSTTERAPDPFMPFSGKIDEVRLWSYARTRAEILETLSTPFTRVQRGLRAYINFDSATLRRGTDLEAQQYGDDGTQCQLRVQVTAPPQLGQLFSVSTAPLVFTEGDRCTFFSEGLEREAYELCDSYFLDDTSALLLQCMPLGSQFLFYRDACLCDIAKHNDLAYHKPSVCMFAWHCMESGTTDASDLLESYCDTVSLSSIAPNDANWAFLIMLVVSVLSLIFVVLWFVLLRRYRLQDDEDPEEDDGDFFKGDLDLELGDMSAGDKGDMAFVNPMFDLQMDEDGSSQVLSNPLFLGPSGLGGAGDEIPPPGDDAESANYQMGEMDLLDLDAFAPAPAGSAASASFPPAPTPMPAAATPNDIMVMPSVASAAGTSAAAAAAAVANQPWTSVALEINGHDIAFEVDGSVVHTERLPAPLADGPGDVRIGQRAPGRLPFKGEVRKLAFTESTMVPAQGGSDAASLALSGSPLDLLVNSDDMNDAVKRGSQPGALVFDGTGSSFLTLPKAAHPSANGRFRLEADFKADPQCKGYLVAKTDPTGTTRLWALAVARSSSGTSYQFYYRPQGSSVGHRLVSANVGMYTKGTVDPDYIIQGGAANGGLDSDPASYRAQQREETYRVASDMASVEAAVARGGGQQSRRRSSGGLKGMLGSIRGSVSNRAKVRPSLAGAAVADSVEMDDVTSGAGETSAATKTTETNMGQP